MILTTQHFVLLITLVILDNVVNVEMVKEDHEDVHVDVETGQGRTDNSVRIFKNYNCLTFSCIKKLFYLLDCII